MKIEVGTIPLEFIFREKNLFSDVKKVYEPFFTDKDPVFKITIGVAVRKGSVKRVKISYSDNLYHIDTEELTAIVDLTKKEGTITVTSFWQEQACVNAVKNILLFLLFKRGSVVFHAAGIVKDSGAFIFLGSSGSGKSTVAKLSCDYTIISEELVGITHDTAMRAFAIPYQENKLFIKRSSELTPIKALFILIKDERTFLLQLNRQKALARCMTIMSGFEEIVSSSVLFERCYNIVSHIPCYELHFLPDQSVWRCIDEHFKEVSEARSKHSITHY